jgi:prepilin-type N-terminal cleavage/methylation domain-containing protein
MLISCQNRTKGFTLIELLVVIAIIGILSSVVLASLSTARQKSRDAKRISDLGQIQLSLELFFDANQSYPSTTPGCPTGANVVCQTNLNLEAAVTELNSLQFLANLPVPPTGGTPKIYLYRGLLKPVGAECTAVGVACTSYWLGTVMERSDNAVLAFDADLQGVTPLVAYAAAPRAIGAAGGTVYGNGPDCLTNGGTDQCYDLNP